MDETTQAFMDGLADATLTYVGDALPALIEPYVGYRVTELVNSGELVPRERLQIGANVELAPCGLEQAARAVWMLAGEDGIPTVLAEALTALGAVLEVPAAVNIAPPAATIETPDDVVEVDDDDDAQRCVECNVEVDTGQALTSFTRWRKVLCEEHHSSEARRRAEARRAQGDAADVDA